MRHNLNINFFRVVSPVQPAGSIQYGVKNTSGLADFAFTRVIDVMGMVFTVNIQGGNQFNGVRASSSTLIFFDQSGTAINLGKGTATVLNDIDTAKFETDLKVDHFKGYELNVPNVKTIRILGVGAEWDSGLEGALGNIQFGYLVYWRPAKGL